MSHDLTIWKGEGHGLAVLADDFKVNDGQQSYAEARGTIVWVIEDGEDDEVLVDLPSCGQWYVERSDLQRLP